MADVAFIGAGQMGGRIAQCALQTHSVTVCDRSPAVCAAFEAEGARIADSPAACGKADIVMIVVMNGEQVLDVVRGPSGLLAGIDPARPPIVAVVSTVSPRHIKAAAALLAPTGARVVDCPITGGLTFAVRGEGIFLVGGDPADVDAIEPFLRTIGGAVHRCGDLGSGAVTKIMNNMIGTANLFLSYESYRLGQQYGLTPDAVAEVMSRGTGATYWHKDPADALAHYDLLSRDETYFSTALQACAKDWKLGTELGEDVGIRLPFLESMIERVVALDDGSLHADWRAFTLSQERTTGNGGAAAEQ